MQPNDDIVAVPASSNPNNMPATDPALIAILSAIQQTMAENKNLILELKSSSHHAPVASEEARRSASEEAKSPASEETQHISFRGSTCTGFRGSATIVQQGQLIASSSLLQTGCLQ